MVEIIIANGGATINKKGEFVQLKSGYQVSRRDLGRVSIKDFTEKMVNDIISYGLKRGEYAGFWIDDGFVYSDISVRISTKQAAMQQGRDNKQLSILKWKTMECLAVE